MEKEECTYHQVPDIVYRVSAIPITSGALAHLETVKILVDGPDDRSESVVLLESHKPLCIAFDQVEPSVRNAAESTGFAHGIM